MRVGNFQSDHFCKKITKTIVAQLKVKVVGMWFYPFALAVHVKNVGEVVSPAGPTPVHDNRVKLEVMLLVHAGGAKLPQVNIFGKLKPKKRGKREKKRKIK